jgi:hypothetical protein
MRALYRWLYGSEGDWYFDARQLLCCLLAVVRCEDAEQVELDSSYCGEGDQHREQANRDRRAPPLEDRRAAYPLSNSLL